MKGTLEENSLPSRSSVASNADWTESEFLITVSAGRRSARGPEEALGRSRRGCLQDDRRHSSEEPSVFPLAGSHVGASRPDNERSPSKLELMASANVSVSVSIQLQAIYCLIVQRWGGG